MNFSQQLTNLLVKNQHSQAELARYVGVKNNTVSDWINKGTSPKIEHMYRIAEFLGVSFDVLMTGKEKSLSFDVDEHEKELLNCYRKLSDFDKGEVLGDIKRRAANVEQVKKPNIQKVYQAARTYDHKPVSSVIEADITPLLEAPDATDEY